MKARKLAINSKNITPSKQIIIQKYEGTVIAYSFKAPQMQNPDTLIFHCRGETPNLKCDRRATLSVKYKLPRHFLYLFSE